MDNIFKVHYKYSDFIDDLENRKDLFFSNFPDATEDDFYNTYERFIGSCIRSIASIPEVGHIKMRLHRDDKAEVRDYVAGDNELAKKLFFSFKKMRKHLIENIGKDIQNEKTTETDYTLQWYGQKSELIELTKALIENGNLKGKQEEIFNKIQKIFNINLDYYPQAMSKFNVRTHGNETKFLDELKKSFNQYLSTKSK